MSDQALTITVPQELARELGDRQEFLVEVLERGLRALKIERVLDRYAQGGMSFGAAAHQAGVSQSELARHAYARGMEPPLALRRWPRNWVECDVSSAIGYVLRSESL